MSEAREAYLEKRVSDLQQKVAGLVEAERVYMTWISLVLRGTGCTSEETGAELDINEINRSLDKYEPIVVPTGGSKIKVFAREVTQEEVH